MEMGRGNEGQMKGSWGNAQPGPRCLLEVMAAVFVCFLPPKGPGHRAFCTPGTQHSPHCLSVKPVPLGRGEGSNVRGFKICASSFGKTFQRYLLDQDRKLFFFLWTEEFNAF